MVSSISGSNLFSQIALAEMRQRMFSNADTNSDGKISKDEMAKVVANMPQGGPSVDDILSKLDTDGDGSITQNEFAAGDKANPREQGGPPPMMAGMGGMSSADFVNQLFGNADTNGDGKIDKDELTQMVANMTQGGPSVDDILSKLDSDGDGSVSKSEFVAGAEAERKAHSHHGKPSVDDIFSKLDTDGDGSVSKGEFETVMATGSDSVQSSNSEDKLLKTLLEALENGTKTDSSTSVSASQNGTSATSTAAMPSGVLKAYMQSSYSSWSQTDVQSLLGAALQV